jgi:hypothetical protein
VNEYAVFPPTPENVNEFVPVDARVSPAGVVIDGLVPVTPTVRVLPVCVKDENVGGLSGITVIGVGFVLLADGPVA